MCFTHVLAKVFISASFALASMIAVAAYVRLSLSVIFGVRFRLTDESLPSDLMFHDARPISSFPKATLVGGRF